jgi:hypothetical protein
MQRLPRSDESYCNVCVTQGGYIGATCDTAKMSGDAMNVGLC